jgi:fatty acid desaturase
MTFDESLKVPIQPFVVKERSQMNTERLAQQKITWYRCPVTRQQLLDLNKRSDFKGSLQTAGCLALLALTGSAALYSVRRFPWPLVVLLFFIHGTFWRFLLHGFHELLHGSVFKTKFPNVFFARLFAFLTWMNPHQFWASHTEHHKYTLHPPDDLEVVFPVTHIKLDRFFLRYFVDPIGLAVVLYGTVMMACGKPLRPWDKILFGQAEPAERRRWVNWSRFLLAGHGTIVIISIAMRWWFLPLAITFAPFYAGWLCFICNNLQHSGLQDKVGDFRLCCRTVILNPFLCFLYWNMNYHTEHHMYAAVPCYSLARLHHLIKPDLPPCPNGLFQAWKQLAMILKRQKLDHMYQYVPQLPTHASLINRQLDDGL